MKILICYFSGTGNTEMVIEKHVEEFTKLNHQVDTLKIEGESFNLDISQYDLLGIGYPIHAFNAPSNVVKFVKKLSKSQIQKKLFIIKTSGEPLSINNISSYKIVKILKKKNYILNNEYHYVMPYNMIFRHSDAMAYKMWNTAQKLIPIGCKEILMNKRVKLKHIFMGSFIAWIFRIEHWGGRFNGKKYKVDKNCIQCQKCVKNCPVNNISFTEGKFSFGNQCLMCTRCSFLCPTNSIKIGWFNKWKVNGKYDFNHPDGTYQSSHRNYCRHSYQKYFRKSEERISSHS